jgi:hypothetical protein
VTVNAQVRILFAVAAAALLAGWLGLRSGNATLEARLASTEVRK